MTLTASFTGSSLKKLTTNRAKGRTLIASALTRAATSGRAVMARDIAQDMRINVTAVKEKIRVDKVRESGDTFSVSLYASSRRVPLIDFGARGPRPSLGKGRGVTARTRVGRYPRAFIAQVYGRGGGGGHIGVFERKGKARLPIKELLVVSIAHVFTKHIATGMARVKEQLAKNLRSNFRFFTLSQSQES